MFDDFIDPFICVDVDQKSTMNSLVKDFDTLYPNRIVRLKINGEFSPFFYVGAAKFIYKKPKTKKTKNVFFEYIIKTDDPVISHLDDHMVYLLKYLNIDISEFKLLSNIKVMNEEIPGIFFSNSTYSIIDQRLIHKADDIIAFLTKNIGMKIVLDLTNENQSGIIVLESPRDILG